MEPNPRTRKASDFHCFYEIEDNFDDNGSESEMEEDIEMQTMESSEKHDALESVVIKQEIDDSELVIVKHELDESSLSEDPLQLTNEQSQLGYPKNRAANVRTPLEAWNTFFDDEILEIIIKHTNEEIDRRIRSMIANKITMKSHHKHLDMVELKGFIGLLYFAGLHKGNYTDIDYLWSKYGQSLFRLTIPMLRYKFLLLCLRFDDKKTRAERIVNDNFAHIREIWDKFIENCLNNYEPDSCCTIDEHLFSFRGKCPFRVYMKGKPEKYGLRIITLNDANNHYLYNAFPSCDKIIDKDPSELVSYARKICEPIYHTDRNITCDGCFMSVPLPEKMLNEYNLTKVERINKNTKKGTINNSNKKRINNFEKKCYDFTVARKTRRWPTRIFYGMLDQANVNSFIIYNLLEDNNLMRRTEFILELSMSLIKPLLKIRLTCTTLRSTLRSQIEEFLDFADIPEYENPRNLLAENKIPKYKRCGFCPYSLDRKTLFKCLKCELPMCRLHTAKICCQCSLQLSN